MPLVRFLGVDRQLVESREAVHGLAVPKDEEGGERPDLQLGDEERGFLGVHPEELARQVQRRHKLEVVVHDLAPLELVVEEVDGHPLGASGALREEVVLRYGPQLAVAQGPVLGLPHLGGPQFGHPPGPDGLDLRRFVSVEQIVVLVVVAAVAVSVRRTVAAIGPAAVLLVLLVQPLLPPGLVPQPPGALGILRPRPLGIRHRRSLRAAPLGLDPGHLAVRRSRRGPVRVVDLVGPRGVFLPELLHRLLDPLVDVLGHLLVVLLRVVVLVIMNRQANRQTGKQVQQLSDTGMSLAHSQYHWHSISK